MSEAAPQDDYITLAADTLVGDLRDFLLDRLKHDHEPLPWNLRSEDKQRETITRTELAVRHWVFRACSIIAAGGQKAARASLVKMQAKDGIQLQVNVNGTDPLRHELMDHVGGAVLIVLADTHQFLGERSPVPVKKDQGDIIDTLDEAAE